MQALILAKATCRSSRAGVCRFRASAVSCVTLSPGSNSRGSSGGTRPSDRRKSRGAGHGTTPAMIPLPPLPYRPLFGIRPTRGLVTWPASFPTA